jgi:hypothetical protein
MWIANKPLQIAVDIVPGTTETTVQPLGGGQFQNEAAAMVTDMTPRQPPLETLIYLKPLSDQPVSLRRVP